jgi:hypothetical protein
VRACAHGRTWSDYCMPGGERRRGGVPGSSGTSDCRHGILRRKVLGTWRRVCLHTDVPWVYVCTCTLGVHAYRCFRACTRCRISKNEEVSKSTYVCMQHPSPCPLSSLSLSLALALPVPPRSPLSLSPLDWLQYRCKPNRLARCSLAGRDLGGVSVSNCWASMTGGTRQPVRCVRSGTTIASFHLTANVLLPYRTRTIHAVRLDVRMYIHTYLLRYLARGGSRVPGPVGKAGIIVRAYMCTGNTKHLSSPLAAGRKNAESTPTRRRT